MAFTVPTVTDFKSRFDRDFPFAVDQTDLSKVRDKDITLALSQAGTNFNEGLWSTQAAYSEAYLLFSAHYLCTNLLASTQGLGGQPEWLANAKAVGNVSASFSIPERILRSPFLSLMAKTLYGCQYLSLLAPRLVGNVTGIVRNAHAV